MNNQFFSYKVLNKNLPKISKELKGEFVKELTSQLINTYSHLLTKHNDESIYVGRGVLSKSGKNSHGQFDNRRKNQIKQSSG